MRATISRYLHALKQRRSSDEGFSLIELIVVVAILGILVAIAIPVFGTIQDTAKENALKAVAANGAAVVATKYGEGKTPVAADLASLVSGDITAVSIETKTTGLNSICVSATGFTPAITRYAGNAAKADGTGCLT